MSTGAVVKLALGVQNDIVRMKFKGIEV